MNNWSLGSKLFRQAHSFQGILERAPLMAWDESGSCRRDTPHHPMQRWQGVRVPAGAFQWGHITALNWYKVEVPHRALQCLSNIWNTEPSNHFIHQTRDICCQLSTTSAAETSWTENYEIKNVHVWIHTHTCILVCLCVCIYAHTHTYISTVFVFMYIYTKTHTHEVSCHCAESKIMLK